MKKKMITTKDEREMPAHLRHLEKFIDQIDGTPVVWEKKTEDSNGDPLDYCEWVAYEVIPTKLSARFGE